MEIKPKFGIAVDGSCIGNPGKGAYRAVDIATGKELFKHEFKVTTNNIMEFLGIVHALDWKKKNNSNLIVYSDSITAISWVRNWEIKTSLPKAGNEIQFNFIDRSIAWLANNTKKDKIPLFKWETKDWGENPADFGNKIKHITKEELRNWIELEEQQPLVDITTLQRLRRDFKL